jgi:mitosis inhibitor protein kinase SWE1
VLADLTDSGNASPMPLRKRTSTEADREDSCYRRNSAEGKENISLDESENLMPKPLTRAEKRRSGGFTSSMVPMSPMKRHDGPMNLDLESFGSPSAKRRSVHGPTCPDFSFFEKFNDEQRSQDDNNWQMGNSSLSSSRNNTIPKRFSSLRKSTLQQRQSDKTGQSRRSPVQEVDFSSPLPSPAFNFGNLKKGETRLSLDNNVPPMGRDSPFSSQGPLFNASVHPVVPSAQNSQSQSYIHPLSRTMTHSSSTTSVQDESPTHEPFRRPERPTLNDLSNSSVHSFSKSMPLGATRPAASQESSSQGSFATPAHYKFTKPLPMAFMSTGLISKKNRNANDPNGGLPKAHMPDTPCKKQFTAADMYLPVKDAARDHRHSFGTPSTPFNPQSGNGKLAFASIQGRSIFGGNVRNSTKQLLHRKTSFASIEDLDKSLSQSPTSKGDSQSTDTEYPPTPTRHPHAAPSPHHGPRQLFVSFGSSQGARFPTSKLSPIRASPGSVDEDSDSVMEDSPSANLRLNSSLTAATEFSSFARSRVLQNLNSPTPLRAKACGVVPLHSPRPHTKIACFSPVSSQAENNDRLSPHTPLEAVFPPDPSGLSISGRNERVNTRPGTANSFKSIPATPTGPREYFASLPNGPTPGLAAPDAIEVDESLATRFDRVELVGAGEFSQVYRVSQPPKSSPHHSHFSISSTRSRIRNSPTERVWAVKKSKHPYAGPKDRIRKIREVDVLKSLGHSDHILAFVESWEADRHLYIQTEFCEEGSLDKFLLRNGQGGILDTFRTWKILLELSLGLQQIHDAGFIHLDLKPANVLITFEGVLKIADFGMATRWPATGAIEGEGDRQYLGPEVLEDRQFDKPADIFALGLIMVETACNIELPDNGKSWQKLRSDDLSEVPSLTWNSDKEGSVFFRNSKGEALDEELLATGEEQCEEYDNVNIVIHEDDRGHRRSVHKLTKDDLSIQILEDGTKTLLPYTRSGERPLPPTFMLEAKYQSSLDSVVRCLLSRDPAHRPNPEEILQAEGMQWVQNRRRAGASVYEGDWGPTDDLLSDDAEMIDV